MYMSARLDACLRVSPLPYGHHATRSPGITRRHAVHHGERLDPVPGAVEGAGADRGGPGAEAGHKGFSGNGFMAPRGHGLGCWRYAPGEIPYRRLKAFAKANSEVYPVCFATAPTDASDSRSNCSAMRMRHRVR